MRRPLPFKTAQAAEEASRYAKTAAEFAHQVHDLVH